jgi:hypothetical protein
MHQISMRRERVEDLGRWLANYQELKHRAAPRPAKEAA